MNTSKQLSMSILGLKGSIGRSIHQEALKLGMAIYDVEWENYEVSSDICFLVFGKPNSRMTHREALTEFEEFSNAINKLSIPENCVIALVSSAGSVYGTSLDQVFDEDSPPNPQSFYGELNLRKEEFFANRFQGNKSVIFRFANVYGPHSKSVVNQMITSIQQNRIFNFLVSPHSRKQYGYVDDYSKLSIRLLEHYLKGNLRFPTVINVAPDESLNLFQIQEVLERVLEMPLRNSELSNYFDTVVVRSKYSNLLEHYSNWISIDIGIGRILNAQDNPLM